MAVDLAGRWITTDSGQHVFIKEGGGSVRAQVKEHFAARGEPNHPDVGKPVVTHPKGVDPRPGSGKTLSEQAGEARAGKGLDAEARSKLAATGKRLHQGAIAPTPKEQQIFELERANSRLSAAPKNDEIHAANSAKIRDLKATQESQDQLNRVAKAMSRPFPETPQERISVLRTAIKSKYKVGAAAKPAEVTPPKPPAPTLREQAKPTSTAAQRTAGIKAAQPGYKEQTTTLREKVAGQKALREQAGKHQALSSVTDREGTTHTIRVEENSPELVKGGESRYAVVAHRKWSEGGKSHEESETVWHGNNPEKATQNAERLHTSLSRRSQPRVEALKGEGQAAKGATLREQAGAKSIKEIDRLDRAERLVTADSFTDAAAMASPSGKMSASAGAAAQEKLRVQLFGEKGLQLKAASQPGEAESLRQKAAELRGLAERGMKPRAYRAEADRLEAQAAAASRPATTLREMAATVKMGRTGSELEKETAAEVAANKRVPLKGQTDFTAKVRSVSTAEPIASITKEDRAKMELRRLSRVPGNAIKSAQFPYRNRLAAGQTLREQVKAFGLRQSASASKSRRLF
jgi:hypothetical protein